jgi:hypothetical protein
VRRSARTLIEGRPGLADGVNVWGLGGWKGTVKAFSRLFSYNPDAWMKRPFPGKIKTRAGLGKVKSKCHVLDGSLCS